MYLFTTNFLFNNEPCLWRKMVKYKIDCEHTMTLCITTGSFPAAVSIQIFIILFVFVIVATLQHTICYIIVTQSITIVIDRRLIFFIIFDIMTYIVKDYSLSQTTYRPYFILFNICFCYHLLFLITGIVIMFRQLCEYKFMSFSTTCLFSEIIFYLGLYSVHVYIVIVFYLFFLINIQCYFLLIFIIFFHHINKINCSLWIVFLYLILKYIVYVIVIVRAF